MSFTRQFFEETIERFGKTFLQFYLASWVLAVGFLNTSFDIPDESAYDLLFTTTNLKAGIVGVALSIFTSLGSKRFGKDGNSPSLV